METFARLTTTSQRGIPIVLCPRNNIARTFFLGGGGGEDSWVGGYGLSPISLLQTQ